MTEKETFAGMSTEFPAWSSSFPTIPLMHGYRILRFLYGCLQFALYFEDSSENDFDWYETIFLGYEIFSIIVYFNFC